MLTIEDLFAKYKTYPDEELYRIYKDADNYSEEARAGLDMAEEKKGGKDI